MRLTTRVHHWVCICLLNLTLAATGRSLFVFVVDYNLVIRTYSVSFICIASRYFSNGDLFFFSGGNHPVPAIFESLPYPTWREYLHYFFRQHDRKGWSLNYLDVFGHFILSFGETGKNSWGGGTSLVRQWLIEIYKNSYS